MDAEIQRPGVYGLRVKLLPSVIRFSGRGSLKLGQPNKHVGCVDVYSGKHVSEARKIMHFWLQVGLEATLDGPLWSGLRRSTRPAAPTPSPQLQAPSPWKQKLTFKPRIELLNP